MKGNKRSYVRNEQRKKHGCVGHVSFYDETEIRVLSFRMATERRNCVYFGAVFS